MLIPRWIRLVRLHVQQSSVSNNQIPHLGLEESRFAQIDMIVWGGCLLHGPKRLDGHSCHSVVLLEVLLECRKFFGKLVCRITRFCVFRVCGEKVVVEVFTIFGFERQATVFTIGHGQT